MVEGLLGSVIEFISLAVIPLLFVALYYCNQKLDFITPTYLFAAIYSIMILFGASIETFTNGGRVFIPAMLGFSGFIGGVYVVSHYTGFAPSRELSQYLQQNWSWHWSSLSGRAALISGAILTFLFIGLYFANYGIPILAESVENARLASTSGSDYYIYAIAVPLPFFFTLSWLYGRTTGGTTGLILAGTGALLSLAITTATGYRAFALHIIILLILAEQIHTGRLDLKWMAGAGLLFAAFFAAVSSARFDSIEALTQIFTMFWDRVVRVNVESIAWIMSFIPSDHSYLLGRSYLMDFRSLLPGPDKAFSGWLTSIRKPGLADSPIGMTPTLIGESYANFGFLGIVSISFIVGAVLQWSWVAILRRPKYIDLLALYLVCVLFMGKLVLRGIGGIVVGRGLPILIMAVGLELAHQLKPIERVRQIRETPIQQ